MKLAQELNLFGSHKERQLEAAEMEIRRFEDLIAWQKSRELFKLICRITSRQPLCRNFPLKDQITRSSLSVMSNIAEGFDRGGNKEFIQYLYFSKGSCSELRSQLYAAMDAGYLDQSEFDTIFHATEEVSRILQGLINALKRSGLRGRKYSVKN